MVTIPTQTELCQSIRACGIPKDMALELVNTIGKWIQSSGPEWTNTRIKDLRQWYESILAGQPRPPDWFKRSSQGTPLGVWGRLFKMKNPAKVLGVLSVNTLFVENEVSPTQKDKFLHGLQGNGHTESDLEAWELKNLRYRSALQPITGFEKVQDLFDCLQITLPTTEDMTGKTVPVARSKPLHMSSQGDREEALVDSWGSVPQQTLDFLDETDHLDLIPIGLEISPFHFKGADVVGRIGLIQEPEIKLRSVANPNRVAQHFTKPLASLWEGVMRSFPSDCTFDQDAGICWVQDKLQQGVRLAGSDLSSATDLLSLQGCLSIAQVCVERYLSQTYLKEVKAWIQEEYPKHVNYFVALSRGTWVAPEKSGLGDLQWKQGQPLGLYPSFRLLAITNNSLGTLASLRAGLDPSDSFRVIGDDIIMDSRMADAYSELVARLGGEINHSKTLVSDQCAEFAGRVILPRRSMLKRYKFRQPSDESFMQYMSDLGPQAKFLLRPRQRAIWETYKYVPGIAFPGPWSKDSFGEPLKDRVSWALTKTGLFDGNPKTDPITQPEEITLLKASMRRSGTKTPAEVAREQLPWPMAEGDLQSPISVVDELPRKGDPRHTNGMSTLDRLEADRSMGTFVDYSARLQVDTPPPEEVEPEPRPREVTTQPHIREECDLSHINWGGSDQEEWSL